MHSTPPGLKFVAVAAGPQASYFIRNDGVAERTVHGGKIKAALNPPAGVKCVQPQPYMYSVDTQARFVAAVIVGVDLHVNVCVRVCILMGSILQGTFRHRLAWQTRTSFVTMVALTR